jgi:hypothetical protein
MRNVIGSRRLPFTDFNGKRCAIRKLLKGLEIQPLGAPVNLADLVNVVNLEKVVGLSET